MPENLLCNLILADLKRVSNYSYCFQQVEFFQKSFYEECDCGLIESKNESKTFFLPKANIRVGASRVSRTVT